jgi:hypothetical protein
MPTIYSNGGSPNYLGNVVADGTGILTQIRDDLLLAGWTTHTSNILTGNTFGQFVTMVCAPINTIGPGVYYRFSIADGSDSVAQGINLVVQGSTSSAFTTASKQYYLTYVDYNQASRLWITADGESFAICLASFATLAGGIHGGYLDRVEDTDTGAYCIGYILGDHTIRYPNNADTTRAFYQIGIAAHDGVTAWKEILDDFDFDGFNLPASSSRKLAPTQGYFDRYTVCTVPYQAFDANANSTNATRNPGYRAQKGKLNGLNNKAVLGEYFVTEGRGNQTNYTVSGVLAPILYYRGNTKWNVVGMSSFPGGGQVEDVAGRRFLSVGSLGWQGMLIYSP